MHFQPTSQSDYTNMYAFYLGFVRILGELLRVFYCEIIKVANIFFNWLNFILKNFNLN